MKRELFLVSAVVVLSAGLLSACGGAAGGSESGESGVSADSPEFSGPWAAEFAEAYESADSELAKRILADGVITESEFAEIRAAEKACIEDAGFTEVVQNADGTSSAKQPEGMNDDDANELHKQCGTNSGAVYVESLYNGMLVNPNNEDWDALGVQCLIDAGLVDSSFTVEDLNSWYENDDPRLLNTEIRVCLSDPLGLLNNQ